VKAGSRATPRPRVGYPARVSVRDPAYDPRRRTESGAPSGAPPAGPRSRAQRFLPGTALVGLVLIVLLAITAGLLGAGGAAPTPPAAGPVALATEAPPSSPDAGGSAATPTGEPGASGPNASTQTPIDAPTTATDVAIVPVVNFRSTRTSIRAANIDAIASGSGSLKALVLVRADADPILAALGLDRGSLGKRLVTVDDAAALGSYLAAHRSTAGFLRADQVDPSVRALAWGSKTLFGEDRVAKLSAWPLTARLGAQANATPAYDPKTAWTLVAGGDILLDRGVSLAIDASKGGTSFPFDGGTADITGICRNCSPFGWDTPYTKRTGNAGAVRQLVKGADLAIANFENPAPKSWRFHDHGTVFSADPRNIAVLKSAGIDWVSMANNHIGDAGRNGILQTAANLDKYGIAHSGAGANTTQAHKASLIKVGDVTVGLLGYDTIAAYYKSGPSTPGSARMTLAALKRDVAAARKAGADVVIVFPHWGIEYQATPTALQEKLGHAAIDAGADMVIGNHPHWVEAMEVYKGKPIWYALGNFVFDQTWSIPTMEGITLELTFDGTRLVQARIRPHLILGRAQPNFLDPAGDGKAVMSQMFKASKGLLPW